MFGLEFGFESHLVTAPKREKVKERFLHNAPNNFNFHNPLLCKGNPDPQVNKQGGAYRFFLHIVSGFFQM